MDELLHPQSENPPSYPSTAPLDMDIDKPDELTTNTASFVSSSSSDNPPVHYGTATPPHIFNFGGRAGEPIRGGYAKSANDAYCDSIYTPDPHNASHCNNIYAPFKSKIDWEIAQWAKLQGPGSTAFSDLLAIDGVSD
jgi:hypothetical protein